MKTKGIFAVVFLLLSVLSCKPRQTAAGVKNSPEPDVAQRIEKHDAVGDLLEKASQADTLEWSDFAPFLYFKSGNIFDVMDKNAVVITCPTDTTFLVKIYAREDNRWNIVDSVDGLRVWRIYFDIKYSDYNFDNCNDIYIQAVCSNGYALSRGHLLTVDAETKKITWHKEAQDLANMHPDSKTKCIMSEEIKPCPNYGAVVCELTNRWENGLLKTVKKSCPECE